MKAALFSTKSYDRRFFETANARYQHQLVFLETQLNQNTAILAAD